MCFERAARRNQLQPGPHRALGVVLVRLRIAEIGHHAVAHELSDVAAEARDRTGAGILVFPQHLPQVLGIEPSRESRRADKVAEQYCQLAPIGPRGCGRGEPRRCANRPGGRCRLRRARSQSGDGVEQPTAVADLCDAKVLQFLACQPRQHRPVDRVLAKGRLVLFEAQLPQPVAYIHPAAFATSGYMIVDEAEAVQSKSATGNVRIGS